VTAPATEIAPADATRPITVLNPATNKAALSFVIGGQTYTLQAGESKDVDTTSGNEIQFDRGNGDTARYTVSDGIYTFGVTTNGWELYRGKLGSAAAGATTPATEADSGKSASVAIGAATPAAGSDDGKLTSTATDATTPAVESDDSKLASAATGVSTPAMESDDGKSASLAIGATTPAAGSDDGKLTSTATDATTPATESDDSKLAPTATLPGNAVRVVGASLSENDLTKLVELQIGDDAIVAKIEKDGISFSLDDQLKERLKKAGASDRVFVAMEKAGPAAVPAAKDKDATPIMVWVERYYGGRENPLYSEFSINGKTVDIFTSDTHKDIGKYLRKGWNTISVKTTPQQGASDANDLIFHIGPVRKESPKSDHLVMKPVLWRFRNGTDWKFNAGKFTHPLGPDVKEVTHNYRVYFAGLESEKSVAGDGDYVLQGKTYFEGTNSALTLTVFVNGTPLNTFLGEDREVVITPSLKEGKNEVNIVSSRVKDAIADNDIDVQVIGPLRYDSRREKLEGKPIVAFKAAQGWERDKESSQLVSKTNRQSDSIERSVPFMLDEAPAVAGKAGTASAER
jgi:hypothetical protein